MDLRRLSSRLIGRLADIELPRPLRAPAWRLFARSNGIALDEVELPLPEYRSLNAFFVRRLKAGVHTVSDDPRDLVSPVDGRVQAVAEIDSDEQTLQAKGSPYSVRGLLGAACDHTVVGWTAWTLYLSPRDYHRVHAPFDCELEHLSEIEGERYPVAPRVLAVRPRVFERNARVVLRVRIEAGIAYVVLVGALNVSRIRLEGVRRAGERSSGSWRRGEELGRFELGSTVILVTPPVPSEVASGVGEGSAVRMGQPLASTVLARW